MTAAFPLLLMDIGSAAIKWCVAPGHGGLGTVFHEPRRPDVPAGQQAAAIADCYPGLPLRACGTAGAGLRVGLLGLTDRYSVAAGRRAVLAAGGRLSYAGRLGGTIPGPDSPDPVDVLVLVGGIDGGEQRRLTAALAGFRPDDHPHAMLVWAGATTAALEYPVRHRVPNVQDDQLRPTPAGLSTLLRHLHAELDGSPAEAVLDRIDGPIVPTWQAVGQAGDEAAGARSALLLLDVGGTSTDLHYRCGESTRRQAFPELGIAGSRSALAARIAEEPLLAELVDAIGPADPRRLYQLLREGEEDALAAPVGFLACLFAATRELTAELAEASVQVADTSVPAGRAMLPVDTAVLVTGGGCLEVAPAAIARVLEAAIGRPVAELTVDTGYRLWAHGLRQLR